MTAMYDSYFVVEQDPETATWWISVYNTKTDNLTGDVECDTLTDVAHALRDIAVEIQDVNTDFESN